MRVRSAPALALLRAPEQWPVETQAIPEAIPASRALYRRASLIDSAQRMVATGQHHLWAQFERKGLLIAVRASRERPLPQRGNCLGLR